MNKRNKKYKFGGETNLLADYKKSSLKYFQETLL